MDKGILLAILPILALAGILTLVGAIVYFGRGGKDLQLKIKGFGIELDLHRSGKEEECSQTTSRRG